MAQWSVCRLILASLLSGAKYSYISPRGGRGSSSDIKGIFGRQSITNPSTNEAIEIYLADRNYPKFYRNFLIKSGIFNAPAIFVIPKY
jgi:hypothetical protein